MTEALERRNAERHASTLEVLLDGARQAEKAAIVARERIVAEMSESIKHLTAERDTAQERLRLLEAQLSSSSQV